MSQRPPSPPPNEPDRHQPSPQGQPTQPSQPAQPGAVPQPQQPPTQPAQPAPPVAGQASQQPPTQPATPPPPGQPPPQPGLVPPEVSTAPTAAAFPPAAPGPYAPGGPAAPPPPPPGPPPGGSRRAGRGRVVLVVAVVLALLVGGGVGAALLLGGGDEGDEAEPGPSPSQERKNDEGGPADASLAWQLPAPEVTEEEINEDSRGVWLSGDTVVRAIDDAITAWDLATGEEAWRLPLELSEGNCQASRNAWEDRVAVLQGRDCEELTVVDIARGEEVASFSVGSGFGSAGVPAILGDTVAVGDGYGGSAYSVTRERPIWQTDGGDECPDTAYAVMGEALVARAECDRGDRGGSIRVLSEDGEEQWSWRYQKFEGKQIHVRAVVSLDPLVVLDHADDDYKQERILVVDEGHESVAHALDYDPERYVTPCGLSALADCGGAVVLDGFLYLASYTGKENSVVAFDLATGHADWEAEPYAEDRERAAREQGRMRLLIEPFAAADGKVLAYQRDDFDEYRPGTVVAIDPETEQATPLLHLDSEAAEVEAIAVGRFAPFDRRFVWHDGTLLVAPVAFNYDHDPNEYPSLLVYR